MWQEMNGMDTSRFDALARQLGGSATRRWTTHVPTHRG